MSISPSRLGAFVGLVALASGAHADTLYVDADLTTGANDGSTWADAFQGSGGLQDALAVVAAGDRIFVAQGTYLPTDTGDRLASIRLLNDVEVFGSFLGTETEPEERPALDVAPSILSGDLNGDDGSGLFSDNSYHVTRANGTNASAVMDGFHIVAGRADGGGNNQDRGAGIFLAAGVSPTIRNCRFTGHRSTFGGAAGYINNGSAPTFTDCVFEDGNGGSFGGAFDIANGGAVVFERCLFANNRAARGGALEIFATTGVVVNNCVFRNNLATGNSGGAGIWMGSGGNTQVRNCTIVANTATNHPTAGMVGAGSATAVGCVFWDNVGQGGIQDSAAQVTGSSNVTYSIVEGGFAGTGNSAADPSFVDLGSGDLRLASGSPAIDAGNNAAVPAGTLADFGGGARFVDDPATADTGAGPAPIVDMGAFEFGSGPSAQLVRVGTPPNPDAFLPGQTTGPVIGAVWDPVVDHTTFVTDSIADFAFVTGSPTELLLGAEGTLLCNLLDPIVVLVLAPGPGVPFSVPVPNKLPLVGFELCAQGGSFDAGVAMHLANAIDFTIGSF